MTTSSSYPINPSWRVMLHDLGLQPGAVLRRAGLPDDLFGRETATLSTEEYFRLWQGFEDEAADPLLPLRIGESLSVEAFDPPVFAAMCSPDLNVALGRIAHYKRLVMPMKLHLDVSRRATKLGLEWPLALGETPASLVAVELIFFVQLARIATRTRVTPLELTALQPPEPKAAYTEYFGVAVRGGPYPTITFSAKDATQPFLTANEKMWEFFEPDLQERLSELDEKATTADRVQSALLELLPSGDASMNRVSKKLGTSSRTLQRRLKTEGRSFQEMLNSTREKLATHYLRSSRYSGAEISFLLGFEDPNSFFRAFHAWTGKTPEQTRRAYQMSS